MQFIVDSLYNMLVQHMLDFIAVLVILLGKVIGYLKDHLSQILDHTSFRKESFTLPGDGLH